MGRGKKKGLQRSTRKLGGDEYFECGDAFTGIYPSQNFSDCILCICGVHRVQ